MRVLIVDDSPVIRALLQDMLEALGHQVVGEADKVQEAIDAYKATRPDLVALDVSLTDGDGLTVLRGIRAASPAAKVVMITANDHAQLREEAAAAGAAGFLAKPFNAQEIAAALSRL